MNKSFLQSNSWEKFQNLSGKKTFWVDDKLLMQIPIILGQTYLYSPRPYFKTEEELEKFIQKASKIAKQNDAFFLRFEPITDFKIDEKKYNLKKVKPYQPQNSLLLNLKKTSDEILSNMHSKTRYNIRLSERKGVKITKSTKISDINIFYDIASETAERDKIKFYPKEYYLNLAKTFLLNKKMIIYLAKYKNNYLASNLVINYSDTSIYLYGTSSNINRNVMAPYLLQWQSILDAKKNAFKYYDFWGIAPLNKTDHKFEIANQKHAWKGISRFKLGFAPNEKTGIYITYPGCFEISFGKKRYLLYSMFKKIKP